MGFRLKVLTSERYLRRLKLAAETKAPYGAGAFIKGNILLIGEQASDPITAPEQQPFCSSVGCSGWLNKLLEAESIPEEKLFWVNVLNNDDTPINLRGLVEALQPSTVLALGGVAQHHCKLQGVSFQPFYHPQYWKRFKSKHPYSLINFLKTYTYVN